MRLRQPAAPAAQHVASAAAPPAARPAPSAGSSNAARSSTRTSGAGTCGYAVAFTGRACGAALARLPTATPAPATTPAPTRPAPGVARRTAGRSPGCTAARRTSWHASGCRIPSPAPGATPAPTATPALVALRRRPPSGAGPTPAPAQLRRRRRPWSTGWNTSRWRARSRNSGCAAPPAASAPASGSAGAAAPTVVPGSAAAAPPPDRAQYRPPTVTPAFQARPTVVAPLPPPPRPPQRDLTPLAIGAGVVAGAVIGATIADLHNQRREAIEGGRTVYTEPDRIIIRDPGGQAYVRGNDLYRFRYGARDIRTDTIGGETRTVVIRPDGSEVITVVGPDGSLLRRIRRDPGGREIIIIDNSYRDPRSVGGFYVDVPPPVVNMPYDRYIVDAQEASPDVIYQTMEAPPVQRIDRRYTLDEIRYSPNVRMQMPSIDVNTITFETGSWTIPPDQAARLQGIADGLNRAIQRNPRAVFLIEGHTDAVGNEVDNLSLSDRRAQSAAELLTQQFGVPAENLTSQGYGEQYLKEQTQGPSLINRRVTVRNITPLLNGGQASLPPPPPGTAPPR
ncbi:OmpA family protein [Bradyrhizobium sp. NL2]|uniref:OmpA family protein n=1 Tax=Bradyrhizobium sp. NL2 TaxID=3082951 RepID=UPI00315CF1F3